MSDRIQIVAYCLAQLRKVASAHPDGLAKPLGVPVASLIPILATDPRFARVAGPGGWWWKLADAPGAARATSLDELQDQLAAARREVAALKAEIAQLRDTRQSEVDCVEVSGKPIIYGEPGAGTSTAVAALLPGNNRTRTSGGWFTATLRRLGGAHTVVEIAAADHRNVRAASVACATASQKGLIEQVGKRGRAVLWQVAAGAA